MRKTDFFIVLAATCALSMNAQTSEMPISGVNFSVEGQTKVENPIGTEVIKTSNSFLTLIPSP